MNVRTGSGESLQLGAELARGGQAVVYEVRDRPRLLAKIYSGSRSRYREKLELLRSSPPSDPTRAIGHASIAWPRELLHDCQGRFVGYTMPYIRAAVPLLEVLNPRRRSKALPGFNRAYLHRTARNLCSSVAAVHARDYVVGDVNERNVLVTQRALVTLIDVDSFQVQESRGDRIVVYPCPVGRSEYTPPELQRRAFRGTLRRPEHDCFGLGVLVFQLLMNGSHPYRGRWLGAGDPPSIEEKIARGWFVYGESTPPELAVPLGMPAIETLHPVVTDLLMRSFADGHDRPSLRPSAADWEAALDEAERHLVACHGGHVFSGHLPRCPRCGARRAKGVRWAKPTAGTRVKGGSIWRPWRRLRLPAPGSGAQGAQVGFAGSTSPVGAGTLAVPARSIRAVGTRALAGIGGAVSSVGCLLRRPLQAMVGYGLRRPRSAAGLRGLGRLVLWAVVMATGAAAVATIAGVAIAAGLDSAELALMARMSSAGASPAGLWAAVSGALALAVVAGFRGLADPAPGAVDSTLLQAAMARAVACVTGWTTGWGIAAILVGGWRGEPVGPALFGRPAVSPTSITIGLAVGWTIMWVMYGAVAGSLSGTRSRDPVGWAIAGAVFGSTGWALTRFVLAAFAGSR